MPDSEPGFPVNSCPGIIQPIHKIIVPWLFGVSLDVLLFGVLTVQTYVYYLAFPRDKTLIKLAVICVYLVGMAQTILTVVDLNSVLIFLVIRGGSCDDNLSVSIPVGHFWLTAIAFGEAAALTAQWLYAYRIFVISRKRWIVIVVVSLSLGQLGTSIIGSFCLGVVMNPFDASNIEANTAGPDILLCAPGFGWVWGPLNFLCDATITVSMSILLLKRRKGTLKKTTHAQISRVIRIVVETGLATSILVVVYTLAYNHIRYIFPTTTAFKTAWFTPGLTMGKVYSNSMLALLNSRLTVIGGRNTGDPFENSALRSEALRSEVREDQAETATPVTSRRTTNPGSM